jgi:hypothetical protein
MGLRHADPRSEVCRGRGVSIYPLNGGRVSAEVGEEPTAICRGLSPGLGLYVRSDRKPARSSSEKSAGCSQAAKWPPFSSLWRFPSGRQISVARKRVSLRLRDPLALARQKRPPRQFRLERCRRCWCGCPSNRQVPARPAGRRRLHPSHRLAPRIVCSRGASSVRPRRVQCARDPSQSGGGSLKAEALTEQALLSSSSRNCRPKLCVVFFEGDSNRTPILVSYR